MSPFRPDLVGCWIFRTAPAGHAGEASGASEAGEAGEAAEVEILMLRRAQGRIYPGIWQCVTGALEGDEKVVDGALRELEEETGITAPDIETLYGLDQVNIFHADHADTLLAEAVFAAKLRPGVEPSLSHEHDAARWVAPAVARELVVWPAYRAAIEQIEWLLAHPEHAPWLRAGPWSVEQPGGAM